MSDTILGGDLTIYWLSEDRQKRIEWTGSATGTCTMNEVYSAWLKKMSQLTNMSEGTPMKAVTDAEYQIGKFDAGDKNPWFIDRTTMEHLTGTTGLPMSMSTVGWTRVTTSNVGIVKIVCSSVAFNLLQSDIGDTVTHADGDKGTIVDIKQSTYEVWIRPLTFNVGDNWDSISGILTCDTAPNRTATQNAAAITGESIWAGVESIANLYQNTRPYVYQDESEVIAYKGTDKWWYDGHINTNFQVQELGVLIDDGYIKVLAHKYRDLFAYWELNLSNGKPKPAPLTTGLEPQTLDGYQQFVTNAETGGGWDSNDIGEVFREVGNIDNKAIMTSISGTGPNYTIQYYLIGSLENFGASDQVEDVGQTKTMTMTAAAPTDVGPAGLAGLGITFTSNNSLDINENGTNEFFSIVVDCNGNLLADVFEWFKHITMRGETGTGNTDGQKAEEYTGIDWIITYTGTIGTGASEGDVVTQLNTGATGTIVAIHTSPKIVTIRSSRGTFEVGSDDIEVTTGNGLTDPTAVTQITPIQSCPFGTMPGAVFTGAQSIALINVHANDANNYTLTDDEFNTIAVPDKVPLTISDSRLDDKLAIFELNAAGGYIKKDFYTVDTIAAIGATFISVDPVIADKVVGKSTGGVLFVVDLSTDIEYRYRYTSWSGDDFTLFNLTASTATGGDSDTLIDATAPFANVKVGDIILNTIESAVAYVLDVVSTSELTTTPVTNWNGDGYRIGAIAVALAVNDEIYVPYINVHETTGTDGSPGSETEQVVYAIDIPIVMVARNSEDLGSYNIEPFAIYGTIGSGGFSQAVIRNEDMIIT